MLAGRCWNVSLCETKCKDSVCRVTLWIVQVLLESMQVGVSAEMPKKGGLSIRRREGRWSLPQWLNDGGDCIEGRCGEESSCMTF